MTESCQERVLQDYHPVSQRYAVFEDDGTSAWLYLSRPAVFAPAADCWVYNRVPAPPAAELGHYQGGPPPACAEFAAPEAQLQLAHPPEVEFLWSGDGNSVAVRVEGRVLAFIADGGAGYSRYLRQDGTWGEAWTSAGLRERLASGGLPLVHWVMDAPAPPAA
jgi:hypothetical protein